MRTPSTPQGDLKRAQIVLLAAEGRSTRSIAKEMFSRALSANGGIALPIMGLLGTERLPVGIEANDSQAMNRRILRLLDKLRAW